MADYFPTYEMVDYQLALYLHTEGVVQDPDGRQQAGPVAAVLIGDLEDKPDHMVALATVVDDRGEDDVNPWLTILVVVRAPANQLRLLRDTAGTIHRLLHDRTHYRLTAGQRVLVSRRISRGPEVQDQNQRWQRVDAYRIRLAAPSER